MKVYLPLLPLAFLALVSSCGKSNSDAGIPFTDLSSIRPLDGANGFFMANLTTLNPDVNGNVPGTAVIIREGDKFQVFVKASPGGPGIWHQQNVHLGTRCPTKADDKNGDGLIDIEEGQNVWGNIIIPLDADLSSQDAGRNRYPIGDETGNYFYERFANYDVFYKDLISDDRNSNDNIVKLGNQPLNLQGKVIVILGAKKETAIPGTVAARSPHTSEQSFPIACGVFGKVTQVPGDIDSGNSGPVREGDGSVRPEPTPTPTPTPTPNPEPNPNPNPNPNPEPEPEVRPNPNPNPNPTPTPTPNPEPRPEDDDDDDDDNVLDRVSDWWRRRWEDIGGRRRPIRLGRGDVNN